MGLRGEVFSSRASSGSRTYFFNVKENRTGDLFLNIVESKKHGESGFERHQIVVFQEDLAEYLAEFQKAADFMRSNIRQRDSAPRPRRDAKPNRPRTVRIKRKNANPTEEKSGIESPDRELDSDSASPTG